MNANTYMQSVLWCCTSCGFVLEGGQPQMECPICEAYKSSFINAPAHVETMVREATGETLFNSADGRRLRLEKLKEGGHLRSYRLKGRFVEEVNRAKASRTTI
ncbi:MAG: rubredoxin [Bradymonadia bacterium]|jgi:rubredoxin